MADNLDSARPAAAGSSAGFGPSDSSDSGSDMLGGIGAGPADGFGAGTEVDSDRSGTGERASATDDVVAGADILPDRITADPILTDRGLRDDAQQPPSERIDADNEQSLAEWAERLDTTPQQLRDAVAEVGDLGADVEMHLKGSHSTTNADRVEAASDPNP